MDSIPVVLGHIVVVILTFIISVATMMTLIPWFRSVSAAAHEHYGRAASSSPISNGSTVGCVNLLLGLVDAFVARQLIEYGAASSAIAAILVSALVGVMLGSISASALGRRG